MSDIWAELGRRWDDRAAAIIAAVRQRHPAVWAAAGHYGTEVFPFHGWASFSRHGKPGEEDLALSLYVERPRGALTVRADIARGGGYVLAETGLQTLTVGDRGAVDRTELLQAVAKAEQFFEEHASLLVSELS